MKFCSRIFWVILLVVISIFVIDRDSQFGVPHDLAGPYQVLRVIDGDTLLLTDGSPFKVRLIGMDCPERDEPYHQAASDFLKALLADSEYVYLEYDSARYDKYQRVLAYVYNEARSQMINLQIVEAGWAVPLTILPNDKYKVHIENANRAAQLANVGLYQLK